MTQIIKGNSGDWEVVIGLEVHAQIISESKLFSGAPTQFGGEPNSHVSLVDAALPGMLPVLNMRCVEQGVRTGLGINATINLHSLFDRKNYFYPDLPQGYQISQFSDPLVSDGLVTIDLENGESREIGIERIHLEQDAGKSLHDQHPKYSYIDLNRSGVALMEIVSRPDLRSSLEAAAYVKKLRAILRYLGTCDGDMEKGSMRCDANVSVRKVGTEKLGTRCEIKNVNSMKNLIRAIDYEAERQVALIESGESVMQATMLFDASTGETRIMRTKEDAHDYRYFPDPDLLPLDITEAFVANIRSHMPELPDQKKQRYMEQMGLSAYDASVIVADKATADYFEQVAKQHQPKLAANWVTAELFGRLNKLGLSIETSPVSATQLSGLLRLIEENVISGKIAKDVFDLMFETGKDADVIVAEKGLKQVTDSSAIIAIIDEIIAQNQDKVAEYKSGKDRLFGFFVGQVMKASGGKVNPQMANDILKEKLGEPQS